MLVLFPSDPFDTWKPDPDWAEEARIAQECGHKVAFIHYESLVNEGNAVAAVKKVPLQGETTSAIYRGWMLTTGQYAKLYEALMRECWVGLITTPEQYKNTHELPGWYGALEDATPESRWFPVADVIFGKDRELDVKVINAAQQMAPCIVKDYVKSRKHEWKEACFIPDADSASTVISNFVERQGDDLQGGVVLREFVPLKSLGKHPQSGMPMSEEYRFFWLNGHAICLSEYWDSDAYEHETFELSEPEGGWEEGMEREVTSPKSVSELPSFEELAELVRDIDSPFFTVDLAQTEDGEWLIMEIGDGQVSGFPQMPRDAQKFYPALDPVMAHKHRRPKPVPLTQNDLDKMGCAAEGCDHTNHDGGMFFHPRCHVGSPTWCVYIDGELRVSCSECGQLVARIAVDPGPFPRH